MQVSKEEIEPLTLGLELPNAFHDRPRVAGILGDQKLRAQRDHVALP